MRQAKLELCGRTLVYNLPITPQIRYNSDKLFHDKKLEIWNGLYSGIASVDRIR